MLLCIGGNDFLRRLGNPQAEANVRAMVKLARGRGVEVLLIGTPEPGLRPAPPAFFAAIAREFELPYEDAAMAEVLRDNALKSDPVHPNARGYRVIAERLAERLKRSGAI
jgi:acyl-CoA thioesterase I